MKIRLLAAATVTLAALVMTGPVQAATIANSFSNGNFSAGNYQNGGSGFDTLFSTSSTPPNTTYNDNAIQDWTVTSGSVDWIGSYWQGPTATDPWSIDMNGLAPGAIAQTFSTTAGATYIASFYLSGNPDGGIQNKTLTVSASGNDPKAITYDMPSSQSEQDMNWTTASYTFTAATDSTTLTFAGDPNAGAYGPVIGDVSVASTTPPESTTVTCTGNCQVQVQSSTTGVGGGVTTNTSNTNYSLEAAFGTGTLNCDYFVSGSRTADPLVVTSTPLGTTGPVVGGTVTLTFPASFFTNGDQDNTPVCFGANQPFLTWLPVQGSSSFAYQGLLFNCGSWIYRYFSKYFPVQACVSSYSWSAGAETVVIQTNNFGNGDPMYW